MSKSTTSFQPTGFTYVLMDFDAEKQSLKPLPKDVTKVSLDFQLVGDDDNAEWKLLNHNRVVGMVGSGTLTGFMLPVPSGKE